MKIGLFCDSFYPEDKAVAIRLHHFALSLTRQVDIQLTVHTSSKAPLKNKFSYILRRNWVPAPSNEASNIIRLLNEFMLGVEFFFRVLFARYAVVILSSPPFFAALFGSYAARLRGIQYVFDVRDEYPDVFFTAGLIKENSRIGKLLSSLERNTYKHALMVLTVTESICKKIDSKADSVGTATLVRNGFDNSMFAPSVDKYESFTVVFHGNIGKFQDPTLIFDIAKEIGRSFSDIQFIVIGWGNNDVTLKTNKLKNLHFLGKVDHHRINDIISKAHLGLSFRSDDEISKNSFPVKLYEYIGVAIPMLVTPISEAGQFVENQNIGFQFDPRQKTQIINKIVELYSDRKQLAEMVLNLHNIRSDFSRQKISDTFVQQLFMRLKKNG